MKNIRKPISKAVRFRVFARDNFTCQYCGLSAPAVELQVDHISPVSKGGAHHEGNFITACVHCNAGKRDMSGIGDLIEGRIEELFLSGYEALPVHQDDFGGDQLPWFLLPKYTRPLHLDLDIAAAAREIAPARPLPELSFGAAWEAF
jgi:hypothetical protein